MPLTGGNKLGGKKVPKKGAKKGGDGMFGLGENVGDLVKKLASNMEAPSVVNNLDETQEGGKKRKPRVSQKKGGVVQKGAVNIAPFVSALALLGTRIVNDSRFVNRQNKTNPFGDMFKSGPRKTSTRRKRKGGEGDLMGEQNMGQMLSMDNVPSSLNEESPLNTFIDNTAAGLVGGKTRRRKPVVRGRSASPAPAKRGAKKTRSKSPSKVKKIRAKSPPKTRKAKK